MDTLPRMKDRFSNLGAPPDAGAPDQASDPFDMRKSTGAGPSQAIEPVMARAIVGGPFAHQQYTLRRKVFTFWHGAFHLYDANGNVAAYMQQKALRLREDLRVYTDESRREELLQIRARTIIDFGATYDVIDSSTGTLVGSLRRQGWQSFLRDTWLILDAQGNEAGRIEEDNMALALVRRFLMNLIPQSFSGTMGGQPVFVFTQRFNPFIYKLDMDFAADRSGLLDRRLGIAAALLLGSIEGRQE